MSLFKKGLLGYLPANILQGLIGFATLTVFTRILSPDDYGRYALAFGVSSLIYTIFFTWMEAAMARFFVGENRDQTEAPLLYGTVYRLFIGVVLVFAALSAIGLWLWQGNPALKLAVGYSLATIIPRSLIRLVQEQRRAEGRVGQASIIDMVQTGGSFVIGVACALAGLGGASPIIGTGVIAALCLPLVVREDWSRAARGSFDATRAWAYAQYGFPVAASLILTLALYTVDRFLIANYLSEAQAGAYHAGFSLASRILDVLFIWFGAAGAPAMVHALESGGESALKATARQQLTTMAFVLFPAVGGLIMVAPSLGGLVIGGPLREAALTVTPLITIGALFSGLNTYYFLQAFTLAKKTRLLVVAMAIPAISNIVLNVLLIPRMGLVGAGLASALSFGMGLIGSWLLGLNTLRLPVPVGDLAKIGLSTAVMMLALSLLPSWGGLAELISRAVAGIAIYGALALLLDLNGIRAPVQRILQRVRTRVFA